MYCSVLQCVAVYCSVLQCVAVCCSVSAPCFSATPAHTGSCVVFMCCSVLQSVAVCCSVLQYAAVCCSVLAPCFAATPAHTGSCVTFMCCSVLQCVAVCCSVQCFGSLFSSRACAQRQLRKSPNIYRKCYATTFVHTPHEKLLGITWVSNPTTRKDLAARTWVVFWY